jgi:hypothetical protein
LSSRVVSISASPYWPFLAGLEVKSPDVAYHTTEICCSSKGVVICICFLEAAVRPEKQLGKPRQSYLPRLGWPGVNGSIPGWFFPSQVQLLCTICRCLHGVFQLSELSSILEHCTGAFWAIFSHRADADVSSTTESLADEEQAGGFSTSSRGTAS